MKHQRQNSQENIVRGDLVGGNQNRGQRAHELSDSSGDETEQPVRVSLAGLRENLSSGFLTRSDTNQAVQPQKMA